MAEESVRKKVPKKTVRKAVARTASVKRAPRTKKVVEEEVETTPINRPRRKAPTQVEPAATSGEYSRTLTYIGIGAFITLFALGAGIGLTDQGSINVRSIIDMRISNASPEDKVRFEQAQNASQGVPVVDGGLTPTDLPPRTPESPETATSTEATASSTEDGTAASAETPTEDSAPAAAETIEG